MNIKKHTTKGIEAKRSRVAYTFVTHWIIGLVMFFIIPLISSIWYSFNNVRIEPGKVTTEFAGLEYFRKILTEDPNYVNDLRDSIGMIFYSLPIILALSLIFAVILNQKFHGRTIVRAIFFLPVVLSSSVVMSLMSSEQFISMPIISGGVLDYRLMFENLNIPGQIIPMLTFLMTSMTSLILSCGVQTILFLAGLQSIPASLYEASKIEGANKWEEFWTITVPSLRHIISLVMIFTMIDLFTSMQNRVVNVAYGLMVGQNFGESSAMIWFYFIIVIAVIGTVYAIYNRFCVKRWE